MSRSTEHSLSRGVLGMVVLWLLSGSHLWAQGTISGERGFQPTGSYRLSEIESVNTKNGNVLLKVPLAALPQGRGGHPGFQLSLNYNSNLWDVFVQHQLVERDPDVNPIGEGFKTYNLVRKSLTNPGWRYSYEYDLILDDRDDHRQRYPNTPCTPSEDQQEQAEEPKHWFRFKLRMVLPDGSVHLFRPQGETDQYGDDYFRILPNGRRKEMYCEGGATGLGWSDPVRTTVSYYSVSGTFLRLDFRADTGTGPATDLSEITNWRDNPWTLFYPDGRRVKGVGSKATHLIDRNGNQITIGKTETRVEISDDVGRKIVVRPGAGTDGEDLITRDGFRADVNREGVVLTWKVEWDNTKVWRRYMTNQSEGTTEGLCTELRMVKKVTLPSQLDSLTYEFGYNGNAVTEACETTGSYGTPSNPSTGFGEVSSVKLPWGAKASYEYDLNGTGVLHRADLLLKNSIKKKTLAYQSVYDGDVTEVWKYYLRGNSSLVQAPDCGVTWETFNNDDLSAKVARFAGLSCFDTYEALIAALAGAGAVAVTTVEKTWQFNLPAGIGPTYSPAAQRANPYVRTESTTLRGSGGRTVTAKKEFSYDKNGNLTRLTEYDWGGSQVKRVTVNTYYVETPDASDTNTDDSDVYHKPDSPRLKTSVKATEVRSGTGEGTSLKKSRAEFRYDNAETTGNLTSEKSWDSAKGAITVPLTSSNSIEVTHGYDGYGNRTSTRDARGTLTSFHYGRINGKNRLYPTQKVEARGTTVARSTSYLYDFHTGRMVRTVDNDNNLKTRTWYDDMGRTILVQEGFNSALERTTNTTHCDQRRRVIVRSDLLAKNDLRMATATDYDRLGRVRLTRTYERRLGLRSCSAPYDSESLGIKVQTRYKVSGGHSYTLTSNPYRASTAAGAGGESTMGWTLTKRDQLGRLVEVSSFSGAALPPPWGSNSNSTGRTRTSYDGEYTTVTDPAGRKRRNRVDTLGRVVLVDEPDASGSLGTRASPTQRTRYAYDALSNLTEVTQGTQRRSFAYSSLSRLTASTNPESGTINYTYDANGHLKSKTDGRGVLTRYDYDRLNRLTSRVYSGGPAHVSARVDFSYDNCGSYSKGRLCSITATDKDGKVVSKTSYTRYDALGQVLASTQATDGTGYSMSYSYDRAGNQISQTYPSGRVVKTTYDNAGRVAGVSDGDGDYYAGADSGGADRVQYAAHGGMRRIRLANGLWEEWRYNSRLQPTQIGLGGNKTTGALTAANSNRLLLDYGYGSAANNGNVLSQRIRAGSLDLTQSYTYDSLNRLTGAAESGGGTAWSQTYAYDRWGNRAVTAGASHGWTPGLTPEALTDFNTASNRLTGTTAYDGAGNLTGDWGGRTFKYDGDNRMVAFDTTGVDTDGTYHYDGEGRRVKKVVGGATTIYVYNVLGQLVAEYSNPATPGSGISYVTGDHLGSTRIVTDGSGAVLTRHDYLPFGEEIGRAYGGRDAVKGYTATRLDGPTQKFTGKERDGESQLDYFGARYFGGAGGRFTSADAPLVDQFASDTQSWNLYVYSRNNPLRFRDLDGRECVTLDDGSTGDDGQGEFCAQVSEDDRAEQNNPSVTVHSSSLSVWAEAFIREMDLRAQRSKKTIAYIAGGSAAAGAIGGAAAAGGLAARLTTLGLTWGFPSLETLRQVALKLDRNLLTRAGRSLQKKADRPGSMYPKVPFSQLNEVAAKIVNKILTNPATTFTRTSSSNHGTVIDVRIPGGQGMRFSGDAKKLLYFMEP